MTARGEAASERTREESLGEALASCGATAACLADAERDCLDRHGYTVLPGLIEAAWLARLRAVFEAAAGGGRRAEAPADTGTRHAADLDLGEPSLDGLYTHPRILAAVHHVLRAPFRLFQLGGRDPLPGYGQQGLHADWLPRAPGDPDALVTVIWMLDDFTKDNGATRLVPGSHRAHAPLPKSMQQPESRHRDERIVEGAAGSALVFNGHLWHGGTCNRTRRARRAFQCQFIRRDLVSPLAPAPSVPARLPAEVRYLLGD